MVSQERVGKSQSLLCAGQQVQETHAGTGESIFDDDGWAEKANVMILRITDLYAHVCRLQSLPVSPKVVQGLCASSQREMARG